MHNWKNLDLFLSLDEQFQQEKKRLVKMLIDACMQNSKPGVVAAIKEGAYINASDEFQTPMMACVESGSVELAEYLMRLKANPSVMVADKDAIWLSLYTQKYDFLELFYSNRHSENRLKDSGYTTLIYATRESDLKAVEIIAYKVNVDQKDNSGSTALHYNLSKADPSEADIAIGKILIACGADTNSQNLEGLTPRDVSATEEAETIIEFDDIDQSIEPATPSEKKTYKL